MTLFQLPELYLTINEKLPFKITMRPTVNYHLYRKLEILYFYAISLFSLSVHVHQNQDHPLELHMVHAFQVLNVLPTVEQQMEIVLQALVFVVFISEYCYN